MFANIILIELSLNSDNNNKTKNIMKTSEIIFTLIVTAVIITILILTPEQYR